MVLFLFGIFYYGGFSVTIGRRFDCWALYLTSPRYLVTGILCIHFRLRGIIIVLVTLLVGYWALLSYVPLPGSGAVSFAEGKNWARQHNNSNFLPGKKHYGQWDPEGILSTLPAIATCLLGVLAAHLLRNQKLSTTLKVWKPVWRGIWALAAGYAWGTQFPIIKKIWTSSYVLVAGATVSSCWRSSIL